MSTFIRRGSSSRRRATAWWSPVRGIRRLPPEALRPCDTRDVGREWAGQPVSAGEVTHAGRWSRGALLALVLGAASAGAVHDGSRIPVR